MAKIVIALYDDFTSVNECIRALMEAGIRRDDISIIANDANQRYSQFFNSNLTFGREKEETGANEGASVGASIGAVVGGLGGLLVGLGALMIPAVGPVIAAGPLAAALTSLAGAGVGALTGGVTGGLIGALVDAGIPEETAGYYAEGVRRGSTLVAARTEDARAEQARDIMQRFNPINISERASQWQMSPGDELDDGAYYELDELEGEFREHHDGGPNASRYAYERYQPAYTYGFNLGRLPRYSGRTWDEIEKDVRTNWETTSYGPWEEFSDPIRYGYERAFERNEGELRRMEDSFQAHYRQAYGVQPGDFEQARPAYRFGWDLARSPSFSGRDWDIAVDEVRTDWEHRYPGTWEQSQDFVRFGWEQAIGRAVNVLVTGGAPVAPEDTYQYTERDLGDAQLSDTPTTPRNFNDFNNLFEEHFDASAWAHDHSYTLFEPAYRFGFELGLQPLSMGRAWMDIEPRARSEWEQQQVGTWTQYRDAIRFGYEHSSDTNNTEPTG